MRWLLLLSIVVRERANVGMRASSRESRCHADWKASCPATILPPHVQVNKFGGLIYKSSEVQKAPRYFENSLSSFQCSSLELQAWLGEDALTKHNFMSMRFSFF